MRVKPMLGLWVVCAMASGWLSPAAADHRHEDDEWEQEFWDGPCRVKRESDDGEYKEEIKCPGGHGASWPRGEWKDEYWERDCKVKIEAKYDEFKKEVKCERDDDDDD
ncbi:hypothetical protein SAMN05216603_104315 [Pseudomonas benzenivorans]|nr:hypothetical protein [Pseudomonas benzenivorans]SDG93600.1 hypothetical protein SAMN05216603_104315 [Pseudomonas benzenivorans]